MSEFIEVVAAAVLEYCEKKGYLNQSAKVIMDEMRKNKERNAEIRQRLAN